MRITKDGVYSHIAIREALDASPLLRRQEKAFIKTVAEGTIERMIELDYIIDRYASVPTAAMKPVIRNILRSAVYQMRFMDSVPAAAACDEAVRLAQKMGFYNLKGFVNGVLRAISRNPGSISYPADVSRMEYLSIRYSMPRWIVKMWVDEFGDETTEKMLKSFLEKRPLTIRLRNSPTLQKEALASLKKQGVRVEKAPLLPYAYFLPEPPNLQELAAFRSGWIYPQDLSSMLVAEAAAPERGDTVIDLCAAPGGKSLHIADKMEGFGMVEARDLTDAKVELIRDNLRRTDQINVRAERMDATEYDVESAGRADIVICDLPCSGLGVIGRKPDIKYRRTLDAVEEMVILQRSILHNAASYVRSGGTLIYSTCTIGRLENLDNFEWFLSNYPFRADSLDPYLPAELAGPSTAKGYLQMIPGDYPADGFFIARFKKE